MKQMLNEENPQTEKESSKHSSTTDQDIRSLSQYIKTLSNNIENIEAKLSQAIGNRSSMTSHEVINESKNDEETQAHATSNSVNPYKRHHKPNGNSKMLLSSSLLKDSSITLGLLSKSSITDDSFREQSSNSQKANKSFNEKDMFKKSKCIKNKGVISKKPENSKEQNAFLPLIGKGFMLKTKHINKQKRTLQTISKVKEELNSMTKLKHKAIISTSNTLKDSIKYNTTTTTTTPTSTWTTNAIQQTEHNVVIHKTKGNYSNNKPIHLKKNEANNNVLKDNKLDRIENQPKHNLSTSSNTNNTSEDGYNDQSLIEMFLILSEANILSSFKFNTDPNNSENCNDNRINYFNEMKNSYIIRNNDSYNAASFREAYIKDKRSLAAILIQKHWRNWKIMSILDRKSVV